MIYRINKIDFCASKFRNTKENKIMKYQARRIRKETFAERLTTFLHNNSKTIGNIFGSALNIILIGLTSIGVGRIAANLESCNDTVFFGALFIWSMIYVIVFANPVMIGCRYVARYELQKLMMKHTFEVKL